MFKWLKRKKKICANCGKPNKNGIKYAGYEICSVDCMAEFCRNMSTEELLRLDRMDRIEKNRY